MSFSNSYLDKLLNFAIDNYKDSNKNYKQIPTKLENLSSAVELFSSALLHEAHQSLKQTLTDKDKVTKDVTLHSVNLNTDNPGIIIKESKEEKKVIVYSDYKKMNIQKKNNKKDKSIDDIEKEALNEIEKIKKINEDKQVRKSIQEKRKLLKKHNNNKDKIISKTEKINDKIESFTENLNSFDEIKDKNKIEKIQTKIDNLNNEKSTYDNSIQELNNVCNEYHDIITKYDEEINAKKKPKIKKEKKPISEEKQIILDKIKQNKKEVREKILNNDQLLLEDKDNIYDKLLDLEVTDVSNSPMDKKELTYDEITLFPSSVPLERHLSALDTCNVNPILLPQLLYGGNPTKTDNLKIFHGPPGTGKTYRLIKELKLLTEEYPNYKILLCAGSNIGVINMYNRAISMGIYGKIIVSKNFEEYLPELSDDPDINGNIFFSTISMRNGKIMKDMNFQVLFIDEAAQVPESLVWGLLRRSVVKIYLAGDPQQLPGLVSEEGSKLNYGRSLMERLQSIKVPMELLDTQRRMHPKIAEFSNINFYDGKLKTEYNFNFNINPFEIINVDGQEVKVGTSYNNKKEAKKVIEVYNQIKKTFDDIVIISPYTAQCELLTTLSDIKIHTLDSFQGREADAIILTTVRTGNEIGFWDDYRRLNVGLTRARHCLRIIGNINTWKSKNCALKKLVIYNHHG